MTIETHTLRQASFADLPALIELLGEAVPGCLPETVWQLPWAWMHYIVAVDADGELAAAGSLQPVDGFRGEIRGLVVAPGHRGRGLASAIVEQLVTDARREGLRTVCVTRKPGFFERLGFVATPTTWVGAERRLLAPRGDAPRVGMHHPHLGEVA